MERITLSKLAPNGLHLPFAEGSGESAPGVDLKPGDSVECNADNLQEGTKNELRRLEKLGLVAFGTASPTYVPPSHAEAKPAAARETPAEIADLKRQLEELKGMISALTSAPVPPPLPDTKPPKPGK